MLKKFLQKEIDENSLEYTVINMDLGNLAFAYILDIRKMIICSTEIINTQNQKIEFLSIEQLTASVTDTQMELSFPIFEWRIRNVDY